MAKKITIDAGHALGAGGNVTPDGIDEWHLNNEVAQYVAKQLEPYDVQIFRVDDTTGKIDVSLQERIRRINEIMPDISISIHHNAYTTRWGSHSGVEVYYNINRKNNVEKTLATNISSAMSAYTGLQNRGAKYAAYALLTVDPDIIAVLTEGGFMDSTIDHSVITSVKGQKAYATAISEAVINQLNLQKKAVKPNQPDKIGDIYALMKDTQGYFSATDAKNGFNPRVTIAVGNYYIYNIASGMYNISKSKNVPGVWINPPHCDAVASAPVVLPLKIGDSFTLKENVPGYYTAENAQALRQEMLTVLKGDFYIYNIYNGMINITKVKDQPGHWINPL